MKNGHIHSEDDIFHTTSVIETFERVLLWKCYLKTVWNEEESQWQKSVVVIFYIL